MGNEKNKNHNNIKIDIPESDKTVCQICNKSFATPAGLAGHLGAGHRIKVEDYLVKHYMSGHRPTCPICNTKTLYKRGTYSFKKYCPKHVNEARREWSKNNGYGSKTGPDAGWKRGLTKDTNDSILKQSLAITGSKNPWFGKCHSDEVIKEISRQRSNKMRLTREQYKQKKELLKNRYKIQTPYEEYSNVRQLLAVECSKCGVKEHRSMWALQLYAVCKTCAPSSIQEQVVREMVRSTGVSVQNNIRSVIPPQELDIYLPEQKFAIEYNGLYWHSEERKGKKYHLQKTLDCRKQDVQLFHIFSDEWREKQEIVESMIRQRVGKVDDKIFARKCKLKVVPRTQSKDFFNTTHISGNTRSKITFGLYYREELVMALSLRTPFHRTYRDRNLVEIARMASALNTVVVGGFSRLLKRVKSWALKEGCAGILTYADRRFGEGKVYQLSGFDYKGTTNLDYWYTDGRERFNRFGYRAQSGKTEKQVTAEAGVYKVFGCGSNIYELSL